MSLMLAGVCCAAAFAETAQSRPDSRALLAYRTLRGCVTDAQNQPLAKAVVQLENRSTHRVRSYITDKRGTYVFKRLATYDDYTVAATYKEHRSKVKRLSQFDGGTSPKVDLVIEIR